MQAQDRDKPLTRPDRVQPGAWQRSDKQPHLLADGEPGGRRENARRAPEQISTHAPALEARGLQPDRLVGVEDVRSDPLQGLGQACAHGHVNDEVLLRAADHAVV